MIKHLRIDNRMIHGQVAVTWQGHIGAKSIIVMNDAVAADPIQKMALPLAARGTKVHVFTIDETLKFEEENPNETLFVIAKLPSDALEFLQKGGKVQAINVGNAAPVQGTDYKMVSKSVAVTKEDAAVYREIATYFDGKLNTQITSTGTKEDFLELLDKAGL